MRSSRRPVLAKITLAGPRRLEGALRELEAYEQDCAASLRDLTSRREMVALDSKRLRADHVLLRLNLSADIYQLEGELRWTTQARETVCWLVEQDANGLVSVTTEPHGRRKTSSARHARGSFTAVSRRVYDGCRTVRAMAAESGGSTRSQGRARHLRHAETGGTLR